MTPTRSFFTVATNIAALGRLLQSHAIVQFSFIVTHTSGSARRGDMQTPHGVVETPAFMAVGTQGAVKAVTHRDLEDLGSGDHPREYLSSLSASGRRARRPSGRASPFIGWNKPILTDSGGYQVFSLAGAPEGARGGRDVPIASRRQRTSADAGVRVGHSGALGSDIAMVLDECLEHPATHDRARESLERTLRWARRGRDHFLTLRKQATERGSTPLSPTRARRSSASSKAARFPICGGEASKGRSRSASRPTRSAA